MKLSFHGKKRNFGRTLFVGALTASLLFSCDFGTNDDDDPEPAKYEGMALLTDESIQAGDDVTLDADSTYVIEGFVFVEDGATLTIPAGTVLKGAPGAGLESSALIIARGGKIMAQGTKEKPIIFTALQDDVSDPSDIGGNSRGLWGGVIILGKSNTNRPGSENQIEGIDQDDPRGLYGGGSSVKEDDNSGVFTYVSIRYGGTNIGENNEINGLTMGAVGSGTKIEYVEVVNNADDGFEWFGGSVNTKYLLALGAGDDSFDWDEGFNGKGQFWVAMQQDGFGDRGAEMDGTSSKSRGEGNESAPHVYNATYIGTGVGEGDADNLALKFREETKGGYFNSVFVEFAGKVSAGEQATPVIDIDDSDGTSVVSKNLKDGTFGFTHNIIGRMSNTEAANLIAFDGDADWVVDTLDKYNYFGTDPYDKEYGDIKSDPLPKSGGAAFTKDRKSTSDSFYSDVNYIGAFGTSNWLSGWTFWDETK